MQADLSRRVLLAVARHRMWSAGDRVGVAVSGGADSVALLRLLKGLSHELGIFLTVLHFNHQLRGADSEGDERFVRELAAEQGLECVIGGEDVAAVASRQGWNIEDAARRLRYAFFTEFMVRHRLVRIAVAHTADDQAETVLARLARGTGPAGLAAIYPVKDRIVRPLLDIPRSELRSYLNGLGQTWREDASNQDTARLRARLRHRVLPMLERDLHPAIVAHFGQLARLAREDEVFWASLVAERIAKLARWDGRRLGIRCDDLLASMKVVVPGANLESQLAPARRLARGLIEAVRGDLRRLTSHHVDQVIRLAREDRSGHWVALPGVVVERSFEWIWFEPAPHRVETGKTARGSNQSMGLRRGYLHPLSLGMVGETSVVVLPEIGRRFRLKVIDWPGRARETNNEQGVLDRELLRSPLVLRNWRHGDSFRPQGSRRAYKLKDLFRENRVAVRDRVVWPVLTSGEKVIWTRGCSVAEEFAPRESTRAVLVVLEEEL